MNKERQVLLSARMRNLERKFSKLIQHPEFTDEALEIKKEIDIIKKELNSWITHLFFCDEDRSKINPSVEVAENVKTWDVKLNFLNVD